MKKNMSVLVISVFVTIGLIVLVVQRVPYREMEKANKVYIREAGGVNRFYYQRLADDTFNSFKSPCPDFLYSYLSFDVSKAALLIEFPIYNDFWVNQMVADNTDTFAYVGWKTEKNRPIKYVLSNRNSPEFKAPDDARLIEAPSDTGTFLVRYLLRNKSDLAKIDAMRRTAKVVELK